MQALHTETRKLLEKSVLAAREAAETAARAALVTLAVQQEEAYSALSAENRSLRRKLRAEARRLGDRLEKAGKGADPFPALVAEVAYAQWHRLLFARFLAENDLLIHPKYQAAVTLDDCADVAEQRGEPNTDRWTVASEYAAAMLPGIFRDDDPILQVRFDAAGRQNLEKCLLPLPREVFLADDSLGWVYQFWQAKKKAEVNASGRKIGGEDIAPVTQLFTEHYMVQFLLHNSLGAWWAARHPGEDLPTDLDYLRRNEDGSPAAGDFSGWPSCVAELKVLDPCCGSGHFLVAAFALLRRFRMHEEGLDEADAGDAVLRDNLFGLELDPRCTQIAAFAVSLAAWKAGGYRQLPPLNIACCGLAVGDRVYEWTRLAEGIAEPDERNAMEATLRRLWHLFRNAPDLGSLIDPVRVTREEGATSYTESLFAQEWSKIAPLLERALSKERDQDDPAAIFGATAQGVLRAAELLTEKYSLVITNVPYLARGKQGENLRGYLETYHSAAKADLATAFVERCLTFITNGGSVALVTPQNWLFLGSYKAMRERLMRAKTWNLVVRLGSGAFETIGGEVVNVALISLGNAVPAGENEFVGLDVSGVRVPDDKAGLLRCKPLQVLAQSAQLHNPDARIVLEKHEKGTLLEKHADALNGMHGGDSPRFRMFFWEVTQIGLSWRFFQGTVDKTMLYGGRSFIFYWPDDGKIHKENKQAYIKGVKVWGKLGVVVSMMRELPCTIYTGDAFDISCTPIVPKDPNHLLAIWSFCSSPEYYQAVRRIDQKLNVTNATLAKVPFDLERWQQVAAEQYPNGLPEPSSDDPTQWLFNGHPAQSTDPLQVAMARLLGYHWPEHGLPATTSGKLRQEADGLDAFADQDGIVCLPAVAGEPPASQRLQALLAAAYGAAWSPALLEDLLAKAGFGGKGLDAWLRDGFFKEHCTLFHNRPFLWQIWDGEADGFSAIVNYHKLDRVNLERLIFSYLGQDWIERQRADDNNGVPGAGRRLKAALDLQAKLKAIVQGDPPLDIYVRWKPLHQQPIGWEPELNDGVRLNSRPFVTAGVLRSKFTINWNKDRGANPDGSERLNDLHLTRAEKEAARQRAPVQETTPRSTAVPTTLDL
jgi:hypothetical protein